MFPSLEQLLDAVLARSVELGFQGCASEIQAAYVRISNSVIILSYESTRVVF